MSSHAKAYPRSILFEFALLQLMTTEIRAETLRQIGLTEADLSLPGSAHLLRLPEQADSDVAAYIEILGKEAEIRRLSAEAAGAFGASDAHCFSLMLWPHLYWVVHRAVDGRSWGVGFQHQARVRFPAFAPDLVRPMLWTRDTLHALADRHAIHDGWDERIIERFQFGQRVYEGTFVFGMLQLWTRHD